LNTFGTKLRSLREDMNLSQQIVADNLKCSRKVLSNYELDKREPDFDILVKICDFFNVSIDFLLGRTANAKYYKEMSIDQQTDKLLSYFTKLPEEYKNDVIRYAKLNTLDLKKK
jgi:Predicted transcriptional regulators